MTGIGAVAGWALSSWMASKPLSTGIIRSIRIRSGIRPAIAASAASPSVASAASWPMISSTTVRMISRLSGSSSTINTSLLPIASSANHNAPVPSFVMARRAARLAPGCQPGHPGLDGGHPGLDGGDSGLDGREGRAALGGDLGGQGGRPGGRGGGCDPDRRDGGDGRRGVPATGGGEGQQPGRGGQAQNVGETTIGQDT